MAAVRLDASIERAAALISRSADAGAQASALRRLGIAPVRGSGGNDKRRASKGGAPAMRELVRLLRRRRTVALTADAAKRARVAGLGIVTLARLSGRPIAPIAVAVSRRFDFKSWDRASLGKPFGRGAIVLGELMRVAPDADDAAMEDGAPRGPGGPRRGARARLRAWSAARSRRRPEASVSRRFPLRLSARDPPGDAARRSAPSLRLNKARKTRCASTSGAARRACRGRPGRSSGCMARASARRCRCCRSSSGSPRAGATR